MEDLNLKLGSIKEKLNKTYAAYDNLQHEKLKLTENNQQLQTKIDLHEQKIKELEKEVNLIKISKTVSKNKNGNTNVKKKINEFIREIDKCITLLNN